MMMMKTKKMRVNSSQLVCLSRGASRSFHREGTVRVGRERQGLSERLCRLRGNLLFLIKKQDGDPEEVLLLERCDVVQSSENNKLLIIKFECGEQCVYLEWPSPAECLLWLVALRDANTETLSRRITHLRSLVHAHTTSLLHTHTSGRRDAHRSTEDAIMDDTGDAGGAVCSAKFSPLELFFECRGLVTMAARFQVQVSLVDTHTHRLTPYCCTETVEGPGDPVFLTGVCFHANHRLHHHTRLKLTVYQAKDYTQTTRSFLGFASFSIRNLLRFKDSQVSVSLRSMDGVNEVGEVRVSHLQMEGERDETTSPGVCGHKCTVLCDSLHGSVHDKDNSPMMRAVLRSPVCKVYRFQTEDHRWMLVREHMAETPLSFSLSKQLLAALIQEEMRRVQELRELGDLSPHWEGLRRDVISHCSQLIGCYQETLTELNRYTTFSPCFKASCNKTDRHLQFIPTNLHIQRMQVTNPTGHTGVWYDVVTVGAPAEHCQGFKHGGLQRLTNKHNNFRNSSISYSPEEVFRARELLSSVALLQPQISGLSEELLGVSVEACSDLLQHALESLTHRTEQFVHALKDELVKSALLAIHKLCPAHCNSNSHAPVTTGNGILHDHSAANREGQPSLRQQEAIRRDAEYDEEEWDRVWANVAKSLNCIIAMVDRLQEKETPSQEVTSTEQQETAGDTNSRNTVSSWQEQLLPLVVTLKECVREAVLKARAAMTFVVLQGAIGATIAQGPHSLTQRRDAVFSQALSAVVCGFALKLYVELEEPVFLQQLIQVGLLAQFESLLSTYGDEDGMLEDMAVGVSDLSRVTFRITEAKTDQSADLLPTLTGQRGSMVVEVPLPAETFSSLPWELQEGCLLRVHPVLFNIGINQQQSLAERFGDSSLQERVNHQSCELLKAYCNALRERLPHHPAHLQCISDQLSSLERSVESRKRKNVEVLWTAASICRKLNGIRLTSCKSAKDRTSMSVTLEQCVLLRDQHTLSRDHFTRALDCMRREGCRMENVEKNIGSRKYAFNSVQLLTFPRHYRPPDGTYGKTES